MNNMLLKQNTDTILMVSPDTFEFNEQTASTNAFQQPSNEMVNYRDMALHEFEQMIALLQSHSIRVITLKSPLNYNTPDAIFPNNWFSLHKNAENQTILTLYPMLNENRRKERQINALKNALLNLKIHIDHIIDLTSHEKNNIALEGTGSLIFDRVNHLAYASLSPRTNLELTLELCKKLNYHPIIFSSYDSNNKKIYHTNVMLSIGKSFAVISLESIPDLLEREQVIFQLKKTKKEIIAITLNQMIKMAANILEVQSIEGKNFIILSKTAYAAFTTLQRQQLEKHGELLVVNIDTIEKIGGGSARCMMAEIFY